MPCPKDLSRVDENGRARAGSQRQIQTYVNERETELSRAIAEALGEYKLNPTTIRWVSPLREHGYSEYQDEEFLKIVGAEHLAQRLGELWPHRGPCWDALARIEGGGCVLLEAKSHVSEVFGNGCGAGEESSQIIRRSLDGTKKWLGVDQEVEWMGRLYQSANRLAHLYFLREIGKTNAYLINVYFCGDTHFHNYPKSRQEWEYELKLVNQELGISGSIPFSAAVFLEAGP